MEVGASGDNQKLGRWTSSILPFHLTDFWAVTIYIRFSIRGFFSEPLKKWRWRAEHDLESQSDGEVKGKFNFAIARKSFVPVLAVREY